MSKQIKLDRVESAKKLPLFVERQIKEIRWKTGKNWRHFVEQLNPFQLSTVFLMVPFFFLIFFWWAPFGYLYFRYFLVCNSSHRLHPSSIQCRGSNPRRLDREPSALTNRPGFSPWFLLFIFEIINFELKQK